MSISLGLSAFTQQTWDKVLSKVKKAVVFMDDRCAESLHWNGGAQKLFEAGAQNVKQFSSFEAGDAKQPKAVFVVSTLLKGRTADVVKDIIGLSSFQYCVVFTAVAHSIHLLANNASPEMESDRVFKQFEEKLCEWMGDMNYTAEVMHAPLFLAPVSPHLLIAPAFGSVFPLVSQDLDQINTSRPDKKKFGSLADLDLHSLPPELQIEIKSLVSGLNSMFDFVHVREECFAVGPTSRIIAGELANHPQAKNRRKTAQHKASVVFIDRTLDLTGAVGHHGDNLVEKILSALPELSGHNNDVMVDMLELTSLHKNEESHKIIAPGHLSQPNDPAAQALWESMLNMKHKEAVMEVRRHLVDAASKENLPIKMSLGRVTPEQLSSYIHLFKNNFKAMQNHCGTLQLSLATVQTLRSPQFTKWDSFLAFERLLLQALGDSDMPGVLKQILPMIKSKRERTDDDHCPEDLLVLLVYVYSLPGEVVLSKQLEEAELEVKKSLVQVVCNEPELSSLLQKITGCLSSSELTLDKAHIAVDKMFEILRGIMKSRAHMKQFRAVYCPGDSGTYRPLLKQVVEEIFHPDRPDPVDIEHMSAGLTDLLKTGFSMFMKVSRPHPSDHPLLILFVVGGVTLSEVRLIKDVVSSHKSAVQAIMLSSRLLKPLDIPELLFATDRLHPDIGM
ncbi:sec1 family domain-containing protein 2-like [Acipenser oxyrinchus oxyrinchus]|uniref:Sec1 family domain-containing protein 2-like n=1 Tax=Acipenser oxyrinchus oxyrinchus TaxID=40147 RepID=A0AAD8LUW5_ACIOX|nr:sec1 family domain-containing protein 2-like [Acipenser oxyrinchus oxyrinchus]